MSLAVIDVSRITYSRTKPFTRNKKGSYVQQPYIIVDDGDDKYHIHGRIVMWSLLDSFYPDDPLPRYVVEDDLYAPTIHTPSMYALLNEFTREALDNGIDFLIFNHADGWVKSVENLDQYSLGCDIEIIGSSFDTLCNADATYLPFVFKDKRGAHLRRATQVVVNNVTIQAVDIGRRWYFRATTTGTDGNTIGVISPISIDKKNNQKIILSIESMIRKASIYSPPLKNKPPIPTTHYLSVEYDDLLFSRNW